MTDDIRNQARDIEKKNRIGSPVASRPQENNIMTKRELVVRITGETGLTQQQVFGVVQRTLDCIAESLARGETVEFRDFGVFEVKTRKPRVGRNPHEPTNTVAIPARKVVKFKAGKAMKALVLKG